MKTDIDIENELRIFVYGTLKEGFPNHGNYCRGVLRILPARICGKLFKLTPDIPVMIIPDSEILATGTSNLSVDMRLLSGLGPDSSKRCASLPEALRDLGISAGAWPWGHAGEWKTIKGELLFFDDPETRLPLMDSLEEFWPGEPSTYLRVLVRVLLADGSPSTAWTYIAGFDTEGLEDYEGETWFPDK